MTDESASVLYRSSDERVIDLIAEWLLEKGIEIEVRHHLPESDGVGLTPQSSSHSTNHLAIVVDDYEQFQMAQSLFKQHGEELINRAAQVDTQPVEVVVTCEDCNRINLYPNELQGTVQECEHCGAYLDVPGGEDHFDWSVVDETIPEDEAEISGDDDQEAWG